MTQHEIDEMHLAVCRDLFSTIMPARPPLVVYDTGYAVQGSWIEVCPECFGQGEVQQRAKGSRHFYWAFVCQHCSGRGWNRYLDVSQLSVK